VPLDFLIPMIELCSHADSSICQRQYSILVDVILLRFFKAKAVRREIVSNEKLR
jgi:hypothetical protein